jgi:hypothetical protein
MGEGNDVLNLPEPRRKGVDGEQCSSIPRETRRGRGKKISIVAFLSGVILPH